MSSKWNKEKLAKLFALRDEENLTWDKIAEQFEGHTGNALRKVYYNFMRSEKKPDPAPKILIFDIETAPIVAYVWDIWNQNVGLEQIVEDWAVLSWSAKWLGAPESEVMYQDNRAKENPRDDKDICTTIWSLLDEADVVITQNGTRFDVKKLNARFIKHKLGPTSSFKHIDTFKIAKEKFGFTSNKLAYMTNLLNKKYKKLEHEEFAGQKLWNECLKGNQKAWVSMEKYNKYDVLALEELYLAMQPWDGTVNLDWYSSETTRRCSCGNDKFKKHKTYYYTKKGKYAKLICTKCGKEHRDSENLFDKEKRKAL